MAGFPPTSAQLVRQELPSLHFQIGSGFCSYWTKYPFLHRGQVYSLCVSSNIFPEISKFPLFPSVLETLRVEPLTDSPFTAICSVCLHLGKLEHP